MIWINIMVYPSFNKREKHLILFSEIVVNEIPQAIRNRIIFISKTTTC